MLFVTDQSPEPPSRASYLLDGRRVTIADLLDAGLLFEGDELTFSRPSIGETHRATVTASGKLRLSDGQEFPTPSRAARVAADGGSFDGWHYWLTSSGKSLDSLRQTLLEQAAGDSAASSATSDPSGLHFVGKFAPESVYLRTIAHRYEWLSHARERADSGEPLTILVSDLLGRWGDATDAGSALETRIEADLANHGLTTTPNFRKVSLDTVVRLVTRPTESDDDQAPDGDEGEEELYVGLTVGNIRVLLGDNGWIAPNATFEQAITRMKFNGYSQLAVLNGPRNLRGAVTWESIAYKRHVNPDATLADAIIDARAVRYDEPLIDVLPYLVNDADFVFVMDETKQVAGIVTNADVVAKYREISNPFILIGELDQVLRQIIARTFTLAEVSPSCHHSITSFDDLTMGDYQAILGNSDRWEQLGWKLDRAEFVARLDELRKIRNDVMHFNPRDLPPNTIGKLRKMLDILRDLGG